MNPTTVFEIEHTTNDVYDAIYDCLVNLYDCDELPSDKLDDVIQQLQQRMCNQDNAHNLPAFQVWFFRKMPDLYDMLIDTISDAIDTYIAETAKEIIEESRK